jgi:hypothetical protein
MDKTSHCKKKHSGGVDRNLEKLGPQRIDEHVGVSELAAHISATQTLASRLLENETSR